jgi:hypothetical protein
MIDSILNLLFRCSHRHLTRPVAPITKAGQPHSQSYVVCLDCGKQFEYDLDEMRIGVAPPGNRARRSPKTAQRVDRQQSNAAPDRERSQDHHRKR